MPGEGSNVGEASEQQQDDEAAPSAVRASAQGVGEDVDEEGAEAMHLPEQTRPLKAVKTPPTPTQEEIDEQMVTHAGNKALAASRTGHEEDPTELAGATPGRAGEGAEDTACHV